VRPPCLTYAPTTRQEYGIWGGRDENGRRLLHRQWRQTRSTASEEPPNPEPAAAAPPGWSGPPRAAYFSVGPLASWLSV